MAQIKQKNYEESIRVRRWILLEKLVHNLKHCGYVQTPQLEEAFRAVPRHAFLPNSALEDIYSFHAVITRTRDGIPISSSSQPPQMATLLEQIDLKPGQKVLEIGAGTGYNAGLMAHIVGENGQVITIDIDDDIVSDAQENLKSAGISNVVVVCGDGGFGYSDNAPYDRIILSVGAWDLAPAWIEQLKPGGKLLVPLWIRGEQRSITFQLVHGILYSASIERIGFIRLRGAFQGPESFLLLDPDTNFTLTADNISETNTDEQSALFMKKGKDEPIKIRATSDEIFNDLSLWIAVSDPDFFILTAEGEPEDIGSIPYLFGYPGKMHSAIGSRTKEGMCILIHPLSISQDYSQVPKDSDPFDLYVRSYGNVEELFNRFVGYIQAWEDSGRPSVKNLTIKALPAGTDYSPFTNEVVIEKKRYRFVFTWN